MTVEGQTWFPICEVPADMGLKDGDHFTAKGWRYGQDGRMHPCELGEETELEARVKR